MIAPWKTAGKNLLAMTLLVCFATRANAQDLSLNPKGTPEGKVTAVAAVAAPRNSVSRYEIFLAPSYLNTPKMNLVQRGFNAEFGINVKRWLTIGTDYSVFRGHSDVTAQELTPKLQMQLASAVPPGMTISVPYVSSAYTFTAGPQFNLRKFRRVSFFVRPAGGALHEAITLKPNNPLTMALVDQIVPTHMKSDLTMFYGAGGGFELNTSKHVAVRFAVDFVHYKLFNDLLAQGQNSVRISIAPVFRFGRKVN
jgi:hypothetical protein